MPKLSDLVAQPGHLSAGDWQSSNPLDSLFERWEPVEDSPDLQRILALPRRAPIDLDSPTAQAIIELEMVKYSKGDVQCKCTEIDPQIKAGRRECIKRFLPVQAIALREMAQVGGILAHIPVGHGKCCDASTEIMDYKTGRRRRLDESGPLSVASLNSNLEIRSASAFRSGSKYCKKVILANGNHLIASLDHPILTQRGWVEINKLLITDVVAVPRKLPEPIHCTKATNEEVSFIAYMLSDGGLSQDRMGFTNMTTKVIHDWMKCSKSLGYGISEHSSNSKARQFYLTLGNNKEKLHRFRKRWNLFGLAKDKRLHADLWGLPRNQVALFLNRFWACDGHVSKRNLEIVLASEGMIDDLKFLLLRLGIRCHKVYKKASCVYKGERKWFASWRLSFSGSDAITFFNEVGFVLGKEVACKELQEKLLNTKRNTNYDVVPVGYTEVQEIMDELCITKEQPCGLASKYSLGCRCQPCRDAVYVQMSQRKFAVSKGITTRATVKQFAGTPRTDISKFLKETPGQYISRSKFIEFCRLWDYTGKYAHFANEDVGWEKIKSLTEVGKIPVYDLTVPETHNFVANGMIVHNTTLSIMAILALELKPDQVGVLLVPPTLLDQLQIDYQLIREHFKVPAMTVHIGAKDVRVWTAEGVPTLHVVAYSKLSSVKSSDLLELIRPAAIIADEVDLLKSKEAARVRRFLRFYSGNDRMTQAEKEERLRTTKFCGWTGSLTDSKIQEFAHLSTLALRGRSPLPMDPQEVESWGRVLNASPNPAPAGALMALCEPGESVRSAFHRLLTETPGFIVVSGNTSNRITTGEHSGKDVENEIIEREVEEIPEVIREALEMVRGGERPDMMVGSPMNETLVDALSIARCAQEVASGLLLRWKFPPIHGVPQERTTIEEWYAARKDFMGELRDKLKESQEHLDSPKLCENAAKRFHGDMANEDRLPEWKSYAWTRWRDIKDKVVYEPEAIRLHPYLVEDAIAWTFDHRGILWYQYKELARWISEESEKYGPKLAVHEGGKDAGSRIKAENGEQSIICSLRSHGRGRDGLQHLFNEQLIINHPASAALTQQLLGRLDRKGQREQTVKTYIYLHVDELRKTFAQALTRAQYIEETIGERQKLLKGYR